jgi:inhibitor of KinA sporulation pathway (predicted exonuclease)
MLKLPQKIIIFDLEFTAWEGSLKRGWSKPDEHREIVQIGAVLFDTERLKELDHFMMYVKPEKNPILSDYFINLTGITQKIVNRDSVSFSEALKKFKEWSLDYPLYSWGGTPGNGADERWFKENCELLNISFPFTGDKFYDIRHLFKNEGIPVEKYESGTIIKAFGKESKNRAHDGLNDARTIAYALCELARR